MPTPIAASTTRSISRLRIMHAVASPSAPRGGWRRAGRTSSKTSSAVGDARIPSLSFSRWPSEKPGIPFSTTKSEIAATASLGPGGARVDEEGVAELGVAHRAVGDPHLRRALSVHEPSACAPRARSSRWHVGAGACRSDIPMPPPRADARAGSRAARRLCSAPMCAPVVGRRAASARQGERQKAGSEPAPTCPSTQRADQGGAAGRG